MLQHGGMRTPSRNFAMLLASVAPRAGPLPQAPAGGRSMDVIELGLPVRIETRRHAHAPWARRAARASPC